MAAASRPRPPPPAARAAARRPPLLRLVATLLAALALVALNNGLNLARPPPSSVRSSRRRPLPAAGRAESLSSPASFPLAVCLADGPAKEAAAACGSETPRELRPDAPSSLPPLQPSHADGSKSAKSARKDGIKRGRPQEGRPYLRESEEDGCGAAADYQRRGPPSTCNDVHGLPIVGGHGGLHESTYLTHGVSRSVYVVDFEGRDKERVILKTNRLDGKDFTEKSLERSQLDAIVLGEAGGPVDDNDPGGPSDPLLGSNVLGAYQYCAFSFVSPYATSGTLEGYVRRRGRDGLSPKEMYDLSLQAARGLARTHLHRPDGVATFAHTDVKPLQFLLFGRGEGQVPAVRLNDFNRGFLLGYDERRRGVCRFDMCGVRPNASMYRSPEEWTHCAGQDDRVDVYALGGVIYFIVTGGLKPWHYATFKTRLAGLRGGKTSMFPGDEGYGGGGGRRGRGKGAKAAADKEEHIDGVVSLDGKEEEEEEDLRH
ncbi:hypothetical protein THAOC_31499 [Thalassiosira oceanica]|uniref:Protein kinase domain-containing protein n=1 Tax=Thalassiosira oceanica TaxID=159749 RepID=K0RBE5_THAOC|nr:hypothetical protein THAOC_31499 [Thalassiosira oceanica]|eukprot:EJK49609.1 hypothetical protein THAOC_31499 [Thalassiosira oceanica]